MLMRLITVPAGTSLGWHCDIVAPFTLLVNGHHQETYIAGITANDDGDRTSDFPEGMQRGLIRSMAARGY